uniref:Neuralized E3 ubiquitin protein ligase 1 n=1 Tax=Sarcophilus harrisii TaxID=9305 RepID=A0A7N4NPH7_SARHA
MGNSFSSIPALPRGSPNRGPRVHRQHLQDSIGGPFPSTSHRCHHKQKHCLPPPPGGSLPATPLLFHPHTKGSQILMDLSHKAVKRQASFCNAITFSNRPVLIYEQVRLKITKKQCCWSGALRLGFTCKDPSRINPDTLPNGVRTADPLWALVDVYGLTRGVQLLESEIVPPDCLRPRSFTAIRRPSLRRDPEDTRLSVSLCDLNVQDGGFQAAAIAASACSIPQNSLNSQHCHLLPPQLESDLRFHQLRGAHIKILDEQTVARLEHAREERTLVFTSRPLRVGETIFVKVNKSNTSRPGTLSYGVTTCDPGTLRPSDLPYNPEALVDRKEFWAVCRVPGPLHSGDILGFMVTADGELHLSHNGAAAGMQLCVDVSQPLWMLFSLHGAITQIRVLGSTILTERGVPSLPSSPASSPTSPTGLCSRLSDPLLSACSSGPPGSSLSGTAPNSPVSLPESPLSPGPGPGPGPWSDECTICYENTVDTVIYTCGHMCLCYSCGLRLKKTVHACCPICRRVIKDIIKTYRST